MSRSTKNNAVALNIAPLAAFGKELANAAHDHAVQAGNHWSRALTLIVPFLDAGKGEEALVAMFKPGKGNGEKAAWYRTYKSVLTRAVKLGVKLKAGMGMKAAQAAVQAAQDASTTDDERLETAMLMVGRMILALREKGVKDADILKAADAASKARAAAAKAAKADAKAAPKATRAPRQPKASASVAVH